jgi:hypothetical protein
MLIILQSISPWLSLLATVVSISVAIIQYLDRKSKVVVIFRICEFQSGFIHSKMHTRKERQTNKEVKNDISQGADFFIGFALQNRSKFPIYIDEVGLKEYPLHWSKRAVVATDISLPQGLTYPYKIEAKQTVSLFAPTVFITTLDRFKTKYAYARDGIGKYYYSGRLSFRAIIPLPNERRGSNR